MMIKKLGGVKMPLGRHRLARVSSGAVTRVLGGVLVLATAISITSTGPAQAQAASGKSPYLIASPIDLTGSSAQLGASLSAGLNAAVTQVNNSGGILGHPVKVTYKDTQSNPQTAAQVLTSMVQTGNYIAAIPASGGSTTLPMLGVMKSSGILGLLVGSAPNLGNPAVYPTVFDVAASYASSGTALACAATTFKPKTAAIIQLDDPFNATDSSTATTVLEKKGIKVVDHEVYEMGATNIIPQMQRIQAAHPSILLMSTYYFETGPIFSALQQLNYNVQVVGDTGVSSGPPRAVLPASITIPANAQATSPTTDVRIDGKLSAQQKNIIALLDESVHGKFESALAQYLYDYDALELVRWAADKAKSTDTKAMVHALETLKAHPENTGAISEPSPPFSPTSHIYGPEPEYLEVYGGNFVTGTFPEVKPVPSC